LARFHDCRSATEYTIDEFADKLQWYFDCTQTPEAAACSCLNLPREGYDLTAVIAHSQGGLATLELEARRWSTFDAVGELMEQLDPDQRLVQTLGTPWLGTEAGVIAEGFLYGLLGPFAVVAAESLAGCDLDHEGYGSTLRPGSVYGWLEEIPGGARARTWFKITEHPRSGTKRWCGPLSPGAGRGSGGRDDGAVGVVSGRGLSGGHDLGTKEGRCHNNGMKHFCQRQDKEIVDDFCEHTVLGLFDPDRDRYCDTGIEQP
jgi:hypothetical protein